MKIYAGQATGSFAVDGALNVSGSIAVSGLVDGIDLQLLSSSLDTNKASVTELSDVSGALALAISSISTDFADITNKPTLVSSSLQFNTLDTPFTGSFTGSFYGDGSNLSGVTSYTDADTLTYINSLGVVSSSAQINTGSFSGSFTGEFTGDGSGLTNLPFNSAATASFALTSSITVQHGLGSKSITVDVYDSSDILIIPQQITLVDNNNVKIDFAGDTAGYVVVAKGGHLVSGSIDFANVTNKPTLISSSAQLAGLGLATTGSNIFIGNQSITGSLITSGSIVEFNIAWPEEGSEQHIIKTEPFIVSSSQGLKSYSYGALALEHHTEDGGYEHNAFKLYMYDDHTNPSYGSEFLLGPVRAQMRIDASGSNALGNISTQDVGDGTTRTLLYGNLVQLGAVLTDDIIIGNASAAVEISGSSVGISGSTTIEGDLSVSGKITAQEFHTEYVSSSIVYQSGSTKFGDTSDDTHQFTGSVIVSNGLTGSVKATGHIIPSENNLFDLGSPTNQFRHLYLSTASLYMDGTKILSSNADVLTFTTDVGQSIKILETGLDDITLQTDAGNIELKGTVEIASGKKIIDSAGTVIQFGDSLGVSGSIQVSGTVDGIDLQLMSSSLATRVSDVELFSSSLSSTFATDAELSAVSGALASSLSTLSIDFADIINKPEILSSSAQIASDISGSFNSTSSSLAQRISTNEGSVSSLNSVTSSFLLNTTDTLEGDLTVTGKVTAQEFHTEYVSSSIIYQSGSTKFGDTSDDKHQFTGSLLTTGNVGIGTTSPSTKLEILYPSYISKDTSQGLLRLVGQSNDEYAGDQLSAGTAIEFYNKWSGGDAYSVARIAGRGSQSYDGGLQFDVAQNTAPGQSNFVNAITILKTTNVGIGTASPSEKLHVNGNAYISGVGNGLYFDTDSSGKSITQYVANQYEFHILNARGNSGRFILGDSSISLGTSSTPFFYINTSNGNVGIGTTSPSQLLHVNGYARFNGYQLWETGGTISAFVGYEKAWLGTGSSNNLAISAEGSNGISFFTNGTTSHRMVIDTSGNVGIGTSSPTVKLDVAGGINTTDVIRIVKDPSDTIQQGPSVYLVGGTGSSYTQLQQGVGRFIIFGYDGSSWGEKMTIRHSDGNVGIGTTSPSTHLHVSSGTHTKLRVATTGTADASVEILGYDGGVHIGDPINGNRWAIWNDGASTSSSLKIGSYALGTWYADSAQAMAITSTGNVGIGTASPTEKLHIYHGSGNGPEIKLQNSSTTYFVRAYTDRLNFLAFDGASTYSEGISVKASNGYVGVGVTNPDRKLSVDGSVRVGRATLGWYEGGSNAWDGYAYLHLKTNLDGGGSGNVEYTMSLFRGRYYSYSAEIREGSLGFHNWSGNFYGVTSTGTFWSSPYMSSDGKVVLVVNINSGNYLGVTIDWYQAYPYAIRSSVVTAVSPSNSSSGVY